MKKYIVSLFIVFCLLLSLFPMSIYANVSQEDKIDTVKMVGFMQGDEEGNLNLDKNVTRAEFVTMTVRASSYKDSVGTGNSGFSMFSDVKSSHWASEFVQIAVQEGWVSGYTDGSFRPNNMITLEEACTVLLNMLGYDSSTLVGSFPDAQLNKASSIGLRDDLLVSKGSLMTRMDCVELFYNLLLSKNSNGKLYGEVLGYKIVDDKVDLDSLILDDMKGPYIATDKTDLNFKIKNIYKDNEKVDSYNLNQYDVYYYNKDAEVLWVYTDKVAGKITSLGPNSTEPTSIMIAGNTYNINNSDVKHQLSILGDGDLTGEVVTLLFGMNNDVVGIITGEDVETTYYGVVQKSSKELFTEDNAHIETVVTVACTDGVVRTFSTDRDVKYEIGSLLSVNIEKGEVEIKRLSEKSITGKINKQGTKFDDYVIADNIKIIDTTDEGDVVNIDIERLKGVSINSRSAVRYYSLNEDDEIEHLILENVTGDTWTYGYLSNVTDLSFEMNINVIYTYWLNGKSMVLNSQGIKYAADVGGIGIIYNSDGSIKSMRNMKSTKITDIGITNVKSNNKIYNLADDIQVYLRKGSSFYLTTIDTINETDYNLTGWYDTASGGAGGLIRMIIAVEK